MLLTMPGCNLSPLFLYTYMTNPQLSAAKRAKGVSAGGIGFGFAALDVRGGRGERG
jgi:hypothetical protein